MKKISIALSAITVIAGACTKLDVTPESQYIDTNFPKTPADYQALIGTHLYAAGQQICY